MKYIFFAILVFFSCTTFVVAPCDRLDKVVRDMAKASAKAEFPDFHLEGVTVICNSYHSYTAKGKLKKQEYGMPVEVPYSCLISWDSIAGEWRIVSK